jgi:hypothetical protein
MAPSSTPVFRHGSPNHTGTCHQKPNPSRETVPFYSKVLSPVNNGGVSSGGGGGMNPDEGGVEGGAAGQDALALTVRAHAGYEGGPGRQAGQPLGHVPTHPAMAVGAQASGTGCDNSMMHGIFEYLQ